VISVYRRVIDLPFMEVSQLTNSTVFMHEYPER
jgi:hypothetical protein